MLLTPPRGLALNLQWQRKPEKNLEESTIWAEYDTEKNARWSSVVGKERKRIKQSLDNGDVSFF